MSDSRLRIVVTGIIAEHPWLGGVAWDYVQYPVGLHRLGHDVYYIEDSGQWPYTLDGGPKGDDWVAKDCALNVRHLDTVMRRFDLGDRWAYRFPLADEWYGLSEQKLREVVATADLVINVSGTLEHPEKYRAARSLAYIDSDPVFTQAKIAGGDADFTARVACHDSHFSFGERLSSLVPATRFDWRPTRQPVLLSEWHPQEFNRGVYTTVMSWTSYKPLILGGRSYGQKDIEFMKFLELPAAIRPAALEVALGPTRHADWEGEAGELAPAVAALVRAHPEWTARELLAATGWRVVDAINECPNLDSYRRYIETSKGEWSVAKHGYVTGQAGWFSCRSACYLASGRPVIVQDTGFSAVLPTGEGLLAFRTLNEAAAAIVAVEADYPRHCAAARALAEMYFDSAAVLTRLIETAMSLVQSPRPAGA